MTLPGTTKCEKCHFFTASRRLPSSINSSHKFAALWVCRVTKMSTFAPDASRSVKDIYDEKIPAVDGCSEDGDVNAEETHIVSPKVITYLKWHFFFQGFICRAARSGYA